MFRHAIDAGKVANKCLDLHLLLQVLPCWEHHDVQALAKANTLCA